MLMTDAYKKRYVEQVLIQNTFIKVFARHKMRIKCGVNYTM